MKTPLTKIILEEVEGIDRINEPVTVGIPFPKGLLQETSVLGLQDSADMPAPLQSQTLARWPDKSLKWVLLDLQTSVGAKSFKELDLILDESETVSEELFHISIKENPDEFFIDTKAASFFVNTRVFKPFERVVGEGKEILDGQKSRIVLTNESETECKPVIDNIFFETKGPLRATLKVEGEFKSQDKSVFASFFSRISFFANSPMVKMEFTILNPKAAKHPGGLWDLGDPGSIFFNDLSVYIAPKCRTDTQIKWATQPATHINQQPAARNLLIYQDSSGGENWNSRNHVNRNGEVRNTFKGYKVYCGEEIIEEGDRATPIISATDDEITVSAAVQYFWQNSPKALEADDRRLKISLFPEHYNDLFELQGGEQKTHSVFLDFGNPQDFQNLGGLAQYPLIACATPEWYAKSKAFSYLIPEKEDPNKKVTDLINTAVEGDNTFFHRREIIDEYGWRNFGDLYADHEAAEHKGSELFISHYNNQYDCVYGMLIQFARSGNHKWFLLADQLCNHLKDIDIYHTDEDRPEYNRGLFWHTNHYTEAQTATHRCFSKNQVPHYGGGPALSHNYSTGFLFHYYMTGDPSSKEAVSDLTSFVINSMDMENTLSSRTLRGVRKIQLSLKNLFGKGELVEFGKVYELDGPGRASGNVLSTLLNAYILTNDKKYLGRIDNLICRCIHPNDNIEDRDLLDAENRWMYTIFLQFLGRYLDMKTEQGVLDSMWQYARTSLVNYANWMKENEYLYLEKPEKLEYPNETWAGQDIRKCNVLLYAAKYSEDNVRETFLEKAGFFYHEAVKHLFSYETRTLTRPIALVMQNGMMHSYFKACGIEPADSPGYADYNETGKQNKLCFSLTREIQFLRWRLRLDS